MTTNEAPADIREMYVVHTALRREYRLLPELVLGVEPGDRDRATAVAGHCAFLNSILHRHHTGEDEHLWPKLLSRAAASVAPLVHTVEMQHASVDKAMSELDAVMGRWQPDPGFESSVAVVDAIEVLVTALLAHLALEEEKILPLIEKHITAAEWTRMGEDGGADTPPHEGPLIFGMMMYEGDPAVLDEMFAHMPPEIAATLAEIAPVAYQDYCREIHGTATPRPIGVG